MRQLFSAAFFSAVSLIFMSGCAVLRDEDPPALSGSASASFRSDYIARAGFLIGKGPDLQTEVVGSFRDASVSVWQDYGFRNRQAKEVDFTAGYTYLRKWGLNSDLSYGYWVFPEVESSAHMFFWNAAYTPGFLVARASVGQALRHDGWRPGTMLWGEIGKPFPVFEGFTITPSVSSAVLVGRYFGAVPGAGHATPGLEACYQKDSWCFSGFVRYQAGWMDMVDRPYAGIGICRSF